MLHCFTILLFNVTLLILHYYFNIALLNVTLDECYTFSFCSIDISLVLISQVVLTITSSCANG